MFRPRFHFITLFPDTIHSWLKTSIIGRAHEAGLFEFFTYQLRDYSVDKHRSVDDVPFGGGGGMVLRIEPVVSALESLQEQIKKLNPGAKTLRIYFSPAGQKLDQKMVEELSIPELYTDFIFICGHYEGIDERVLDHWIDRQVSLGDFVLTGGELPALAMTDALIRQVEGTLGSTTTSQTESFALKTGEGRLLEYPHYTRPREFRGLTVPEVLLSGDHRAISKWRITEAKKKTSLLRPELLNCPEI